MLLCQKASVVSFDVCPVVKFSENTLHTSPFTSKQSKTFGCQKGIKPTQWVLLCATEVLGVGTDKFS